MDASVNPRRGGRTFEPRACTSQLSECYNLFNDILIPINQDRRTISFGISLDAHVPSDLTELDISKLLRRSSPQLS